MWFFRGRPWLLFLALMVCKLLPQAGTLHFAGKSCIEGIWIGIKLGYQSCWRCFPSWRVCQDDSEQGGRGHPQSTSFLCAQTTHLSSGLRFLAIFRLPQSFKLDSDIHPFTSPPNYQACQAWGLRISPISSKVVHTLPLSHPMALKAFCGTRPVLPRHLVSLQAEALKTDALGQDRMFWGAT